MKSVSMIMVVASCIAPEGIFYQCKDCFYDSKMQRTYISRYDSAGRVVRSRTPTIHRHENPTSEGQNRVIRVVSNCVHAQTKSIEIHITDRTKRTGFKAKPLSPRTPLLERKLFDPMEGD